MVTLLSDYEVCKEGDVLTPEQARVLVSNIVTQRLCEPLFPRYKIIDFSLVPLEHVSSRMKVSRV